MVTTCRKQLEGPSAALIVNFAGLGNGIMTLPILKALDQEARAIRYFHIDNPIFHVPEFMSWASLRRFEGTVPTIWRRFEVTDWRTILDFIENERIDTIISLRNEGYDFDTSYFEFKQLARNLAFWDLPGLDSCTPLGSTKISIQITDLFRSHGFQLTTYERHWLRNCLGIEPSPVATDGDIAFFPAAATKVKRWPTEAWIRLGELILRRTNNNIRVYSGVGKEEKASAISMVNSLRESIGSDRCTLLQDLSIPELARSASDVSFIISNDSFAVHMAEALAIPSLGLYFSTDAGIWGASDNKSVSIQSSFGLQCPEFKVNSGNCRFYYGNCPAPCKNEVTPMRVFYTLQAMINTAGTKRTNEARCAVL